MAGMAWAGKADTEAAVPQAAEAGPAGLARAEAAGPTGALHATTIYAILASNPNRIHTPSSPPPVGPVVGHEAHHIRPCVGKVSHSKPGQVGPPRPEPGRVERKPIRHRHGPGWPGGPVGGRVGRGGAGLLAPYIRVARPGPVGHVLTTTSGRTTRPRALWPKVPNAKPRPTRGLRKATSRLHGRTAILA